MTVRAVWFGERFRIEGRTGQAWEFLREYDDGLDALKQAAKLAKVGKREIRVVDQATGEVLDHMPMEVNPTKVRSVCRGCGKDGEVEISPPKKPGRLTGARPAWCKCKGPGGPYEAPNGYVAKFTFAR